MLYPALFVENKLIFRSHSIIGFENVIKLFETFIANILYQMRPSTMRVPFYVVCMLVQFSLVAQTNSCRAFQELRDIPFGSNQYVVKKKLLSLSAPFAQDYERKINGGSTNFYKPLAKFNVPKDEYADDRHQALRDDSVYITQAFFKLPKGCATKFDNDVNLVFADDTLYYVSVDIEIPPENLREAMQLFNDLKSLLEEKYPFREEYELKAFDSDEIGGEGIEFTKLETRGASVQPNREVAWLHLRNLFLYGYNSQNDYVSTGIVRLYRISFTIVNYKFTRLNGLGSYL